MFINLDKEFKLTFSIIILNYKSKYYLRSFAAGKVDPGNDIVNRAIKLSVS